MKAPQKILVDGIFGSSSKYVAPVYQRYYVWGNDALQVLLEDIQSVSKGNSQQFVGAMVIQDLGKDGGSTAPNNYLIIDGQQRLTTLYLLICALARAYRLSGKEAEARSLAQKYLAHFDGHGPGRPKLLPTMQDRKQLFEILTKEVRSVSWDMREDAGDEHSPRKAILTQWRNIKAYFSEQLYSKTGRFLPARARDFQKKLLDGISFIQVVLEPSDDANTVFSKLNYEGVKLELSDLVRNDVISRVRDGNKQTVSEFHRDFWEPFERKFPENSFDQFVTVFAFIKFKGQVTKSRAFPELQRSWARKDPAAIVRELDEYADIYSALVNFKEVPAIDWEVGERILRFSLMPKTTVTWPYVIQLLKAYQNREVSKSSVLACLTIVESFLVRRAIVGLEPTGLHAVFKGLWGRAGSNPKRLRSKITTGTIKCPSDAELKSALYGENMYKRRITKYLLVQHEIRFNRLHGYDLAIDDFSVEHVLPQNRNGKWVRLFSFEQHRDLLNSIGNLVPLTKRQNKKIKDAAWADKRAHFKGSNWKTTARLASTQKWTAAKIKARSKEFFEWSIQQWGSL